MVMEAPSAQCVGREFVRQYYTLLHEAPDYLHRFYSHNSCFVHGGVEKPGEEQPPVQGQSDIHKKIVSLNFRDCHAKIRQVDSQATVGSAVVVQVTGELSNAGQPMRRFMQTFVLAPQSPKKYYVHNDIFRYQDEVFHDSDNDTETQEETGDSESEVVEHVDPVDSAVQDNTVTSVMQTGFSYEGTAQPPETMPLSNGNSLVTPDERPESPEVKVMEEPDRLDMDHEQVVEYEPVQETQEVIPEPTDIEEQTYTTEPQTQEQSKPFSWAHMASKNTIGNAPAQINVKPSPAPVIPKAAPAAAPKPAAMEKPSQPEQAKPPREPREQRPPRRSEPNRPERDSSRSGAGGEPNDDFRRASRYPDTHQLFVGNLPHNVSDKELKDQFEEHGKVIEVRINRKSNRDVPNFGFVVFESPDAVMKVLNNKPITTREGHRLNVEEKKQRSEQSARPGSGSRAPRGAGMGSRGGMGGPPRSDRGGRGGGGMGGGPRSDMRSGSDRGRGGGGFGGPPPSQRR